MVLGIRGADEPDVRTMAELLRGRRTINLFEPTAVGTQVLLDAIDVARWAPNHRLTEPWRFYILGPATAASAAECWASFDAEGKDERARQARLARLNAIPGNFVVTSLTSDDELVDRENYAASCCAVQNLMLYLWQRGVGAKWTTGAITREQRLYDLLEIDAAQERIVGYFWYGIARIVPEQARREVSEVVVELP